MEILTGTSVLKGIAIGTVCVLDATEPQVEKRAAADTETEKKRFYTARDTAVQQLQVLYELALKETGAETAEIFEIHQMLLTDEDFEEAITAQIEQEKVNAEYAVKVQGDAFAQTFAAMKDEYMSARAADIRDVAARVVRCLQNFAERHLSSAKNQIVLARELTPSQTIQMDKSCVLSFVTQEGSCNSHSSILARALNLPSLVGVPLGDTLARCDGHTAIVDGYQGRLILDPDEATMQQYRQSEQAYQEEMAALRQLVGKENVTPDGRRIQVLANIGNVEDAELALENDAGGIGLFRSEFLYLGRNSFPTEEEQFESYRAVLQKMQGKQVIIRTLDLGADKQADYFHFEKEDNPAMGCRAIRVCLTQPEIFRTQLRALLRASAFGSLGIMFPMIASVWEVKKAKEMLEQAKAELEAEQVPIGAPYVGIMIETPAAAIISDELAKEVDFFSIGTNDLTQYTLAVDRQNQKLAPFSDTHHKAVLRLIELTAKNAKAAGIQIGICGELGADETLTDFFLRIGIDELSVAPGSVLKLRRNIRTLKGEQAK